MRFLLVAVSFIAWFAAAAGLLLGIAYAFDLNGAIMGHAATPIGLLFGIIGSIWYYRKSEKVPC